MSEQEAELLVADAEKTFDYLLLFLCTDRLREFLIGFQIMNQQH
jgi:hypothetical protein